MNTKTTLVLAALALGVGAYLWLVENPFAPPPASEEPTTLAKPLLDPRPADIDRVELTTRRDRFVFRRQDDGWRMLEPVDAPANEFEVNSLVDRAADIQYLRVHDSGGSERPSDAVAGMDRPTATIRLFKDENLVSAVQVGNNLPTGRGSYVSLMSDGSIYESQNDLSTTFDRRLDAFREKRVLRFDMKDVARVVVEGRQSFELVKSGEKWVVESPVRGRADRTRAEAIIRPLSNLQVQEFKDDDPVALRPYGLDPPRLKVAIETVKEIPGEPQPGEEGEEPVEVEPVIEKKTHVLLVGGPADAASNSFFAKLDSAPWVFSLAEFTVKELSPGLSDLRDKTLAPIDDLASVTRIEAQTGDESFTLSRQDDGDWVFADGATADVAAADDLLRAVQNLNATGFADPGDALLVLDWERPRARIQVTRKGELNPVIVLVGPPDASGRMAYVRNAAEEAVAVVRENEIEQLLLPAVAYQDRTVIRFPQERANRIEIARADGPQVVLDRVNHRWSMTAPVEAAADAEAARNLLQDLASLRARRVVDIGNKEKYGLDNPDVRVAVWTQPLPADPNVRIVGENQGVAEEASEEPPAEAPEAGQDEQAAVVEQPAPAEQADAAESAEAATRPAISLQELLDYQRTLPDANPLMTELLEELIAKEKAEKGEQPDTAPAIAEDSPAEPAIEERPAGKPALKDFLEHQRNNPEANPEVTRLLEEMILEEQQAEAPAAGTPAQDADTEAEPETPAAPPEPVVFRLALSQRDGITYAALDDKPAVYELDNQVFEDAIAEMHDRQLLKFDVASVVELAFESDASRIVLRKSGDDWRYLPSPVLPIDGQKVTDVLNAFRDLKTHRFVDYTAESLSPYNLEADVRQVAITTDDGRTQRILLSSAGPAGDSDASRYATREGSSQVFLLRGDQAAMFEQKLDDFEKAPAGAAAETAGFEGFQ